MSFFSSKIWSKIPIDLLESKSMLQVEKNLPANLRSAPVLFYLAGTVKANEDGIFDIGDGVEFAELIKVNSPSEVFQVATLLTRFRILAHVPDSTVFLFAEWEYSVRQQEKTLRSRFELAVNFWNLKQSEASFFDEKDFQIAATSDKCLNTKQPIQIPLQNAIQDAKKTVSQIRREDIRQDKTEIRADDTRQEEITHTEEREESAGEKREDFSSGYESFRDSPPLEKQEITQQETTEKKAECQDRQLLTGWKVVSGDDLQNAPSATVIQEKRNAIFVPDEVLKILGDFFKSNNAAFNGERAKGVVTQIAEELYQGADCDAEKAVYFAEKYCFEFKKMHDAPKSDRWHNIPLLPAYMAKPAVWAQLTERVTRIHLPYPEKTASFSESMAKAEEEHKKALRDGCVFLDDEYIRAGIDPDDPARQRKLLARMQGGKVGEERILF